MRGGMEMCEIIKCSIIYTDCETKKRASDVQGQGKKAEEMRTDLFTTQAHHLESIEIAKF